MAVRAQVRVPPPHQANIMAKNEKHTIEWASYFLTNFDNNVLTEDISDLVLSILEDLNLINSLVVDTETILGDDVTDLTFTLNEIATSDIASAPATYDQAFTQTHVDLTNENKAKINETIQDVILIKDKVNEIIPLANALLSQGNLNSLDIDLIELKVNEILSTLQTI